MPKLLDAGSGSLIIVAAARVDLHVYAKQIRSIGFAVKENQDSAKFRVSPSAYSHRW